MSTTRGEGRKDRVTQALVAGPKPLEGVALPSNWGEWRKQQWSTGVLPSVHAGGVGILDNPRVLKDFVEWEPVCGILYEHLRN